jgi:hypothetical protein
MQFSGSQFRQTSMDSKYAVTQHREPPGFQAWRQAEGEDVKLGALQPTFDLAAALCDKDAEGPPAAAADTKSPSEQHLTPDAGAGDTEKPGGWRKWVGLENAKEEDET